MAYGTPIPANQNAVFICLKCGKQIPASSYAAGGTYGSGFHAPAIPSPTQGGKCPDTASGNHVWQQN